MKVAIYTLKNTSILEGLKVEFSRLRVYPNNGIRRC